MERIITVVLVLGCVQPAWAESPYEVDSVRDGVFVGAGTLLLVLSDGLVKRVLRSEPACRTTSEGLCDPEKLDWPDSTAVGNYSEGWRLVSDIGLFGGFALGAFGVGLLFGHMWKCTPGWPKRWSRGCV